jgi:hypothetical protein
MKRRSDLFPGFLLLGWLILPALGAEAQSALPGDYTMQSGEVTLNLQLAQQGNVLQGTLSGSTGAAFQLSGQVENGIGYGTCSGAEGTVYFEVYADGADLTLSLIEPDAYGAPDYNQAQYLQFTRTSSSLSGSQSSGTTGAVTGALGLGNTGQADPAQSQQYGSPVTGQPGFQGAQGNAVTGSQGNAMTGSQGSASVGENEVGDPNWGLKFGLPQGWVKRNSLQGAIVGHNTIPGMILVIPHMSSNMQEMQNEMMQGIQEEGSYLAASGGLAQVSQNVLSGEYNGVADGTQVKAKGYGILSPNGGGVYLIALSTPDKLGPELLAAAESMVNTVKYFKVDVSDLVRHFAGNWAHFTSNTSTWICFCADGTYSEQYESSYSGNFNDGAGNYTGDWSAMGQDSDRGRWTVRGNKDTGTIIVKLANGKEIYYEYRVHEERGEKYYREYWLNGNLYSKKRE